MIYTIGNIYMLCVKCASHVAVVMNGITVNQRVQDTNPALLVV